MLRFSGSMQGTRRSVPDQFSAEDDAFVVGDIPVGVVDSSVASALVEGDEFGGVFGGVAGEFVCALGTRDGFDGFE